MSLWLSESVQLRGVFCWIYEHSVDWIDSMHLHWSVRSVNVHHIFRRHSVVCYININLKYIHCMGVAPCFYFQFSFEFFCRAQHKHLSISLKLSHCLLFSLIFFFVFCVLYVLFWFVFFFISFNRHVETSYIFPSHRSQFVINVIFVFVFRLLVLPCAKRIEWTNKRTTNDQQFERSNAVLREFNMNARRCD